MHGPALAATVAWAVLRALLGFWATSGPVELCQAKAGGRRLRGQRVPWVLLVPSLLKGSVWLLPSPWAQSIPPHDQGMCMGTVPWGSSQAGLLHPAGPITSSCARPSSPDPCHNGGSCSDGIGTFFCECLAGFRGPKCEEDINECASNPCKNGANCTDCVNSYTCTCPSGFSGIHCENNTPDCTERYGPATWDEGLRSP